jgi:hypothetical protein
MLFLGYALFVIGLGFYIAALFFIGTDTGQDLFYMGTAALLIDAVLLSLRLNHALREKKPQI